jgi:hypothetical protein
VLQNFTVRFLVVLPLLQEEKKEKKEKMSRTLLFVLQNIIFSP